jgi:hypothetical protein
MFTRFLRSTPVRDKLSRKDLLKMWEESERVFGGRTDEQLGFFTDHGHWPEKECSERNCSKNEFDELKKKSVRRSNM